MHFLYSTDIIQTGTKVRNENNESYIKSKKKKMHFKLAAQLSCLIKADHTDDCIPQCKSSMENVLLMM